MKFATPAAAGILALLCAAPASAGDYHTYRSLDSQVERGYDARFERGGYFGERRYRRSRSSVGIGFEFGRERGFKRQERVGYGRSHDIGAGRRGYTKFCSDHVEWSGHSGVRRCVLVRNDLLGRYTLRYGH